MLNKTKFEILKYFFLDLSEFIASDKTIKDRRKIEEATEAFIETYLEEE